MMISTGPPAWAEWGTAVFTTARRASRPVFLLLSTRWSPDSRRLEATVLHEPSVVSTLGDRFELVRVDADERPDLADRYSLGRLPTLLLLTPAGEVLTGGTWTDVARLRDTLVQVADVFDVRHGDWLTDAARRASVYPVPDGHGLAPDTGAAHAVAEWAIANRSMLVREVGTAPGTPHPTLLAALLLAGHRLELPLVLDVVEEVLDAALRRALFDRRRGGFRHIAPAAAVDSDEEVKLLADNAVMLEVLLDASTLLNREDLRSCAIEITRFLIDDLRDGDEGGFAHAWTGSRVADERSTATRAGGRSSGRRDSRVFTDSNARAACALFNAARALGVASLAEHAVAALERVVGATYQRAAGMAHVFEGTPRVRGLLADQVLTSAAFVEAYDVTGRPAYLDLAEELMRSALRKYAHAETAALQDRLPGLAGAGDVGLLAQPRFPLAANCVAARALAALSGHLGEPALHRRAVDLLGAFASAWRTAPPGDAAHYVLAAAEVAAS